jgi:hypothetical protein
MFRAKLIGTAMEVLAEVLDTMDMRNSLSDLKTWSSHF